MNLLQSIFSPAIIEALGWTIVHAIWQGFIVFIALLIVLSIIKNHSAQIRYIFSYTALMVFLTWSVSTFIGGYTYAIDKEILKTQILNKQILQDESMSPSLYFINSNQPTIQNIETTHSLSVLKLKTIMIRAWFQRNFPLFLSAWLLGIGFFTLRLLVGFVYTRRLRKRNLLPFGERWMHKIEELTAVLKIGRKIKAYKSPHTTTPLTLGFLKPIILFPIKLLSDLSDKEAKAIIAHELAHIVRNDYLFNIIQSVIEILFFYHPAVWGISAHIRAERENACDDIAISITGDKLSYAQALAHPSIAGQAANTTICTQKKLSMGFGHKKGSLLERIKRIQKQRVMKTNVLEGLIAACIITSSIFLVSFSVRNQLNESIPPTEQSGQKGEQKLSPQTSNAALPNAEFKVNKDSLLQAVEKNMEIASTNEKLTKEIEQAIEIALTEKDQALSAEIFEEINLALNEISEAGIQEAMHEARVEIKAAMSEINSDSIQEEIQAELKEAKKEIKKATKDIKRASNKTQDIEETTEISLKAAEAGLKIAAEVLENIDIENIVVTSLEASETAIELAGKQIEGLNLDSLIDAQMKITELEIDKVQMSQDREEIEKNKAQLMEDLKELKKDMRTMKKELKQELNEMEKEQKNK